MRRAAANTAILSCLATTAALATTPQLQWRLGGLRRPRPEIAQRVGAVQLQLDVLGTVDTFYRTSPYLAAFLTCATKAASSDAISQRTVERVLSSAGKVTEHRFCFSRNAAFTLYGGLYGGLGQYYIFNELYPALFGTSTDITTVAIKVAFDQLVLTPFLCLPLAYLFKAAVFRTSLRATIEHYVRDAKRDLLWKYWAIWTPAQCLTFSVVPDHLRIPFIAFVSFFWLILLSNITSRPQPSGPGKAVICYDNEGIIIDEIDDEIDVSVLDVDERGFLKTFFFPAKAPPEGATADAAAGGQAGAQASTRAGGQADAGRVFASMTGRQAFAALDVDGGGTVSVEELRRAFREGTGTPLTDVEIGQLATKVVSEYDDDADGELQLSEFLEFWAALQAEHAIAGRVEGQPSQPVV